VNLFSLLLLSTLIRLFGLREKKHKIPFGLLLNANNNEF
jgi:hypothetical protein